MAIEIPRLPDEAAAELLVRRLRGGVLRDVRSAAEDTEAIHQELARLVRALGELAGSDPEAKEAQELLAWLGEGNFVFLGYRGQHGLGLLREPGEDSYRGFPEAESRLLTLTKSTQRSTVLRQAYLDEINIATNGTETNGTETRGEHTFVGLFSPQLHLPLSPGDSCHPRHREQRFAGLRLPAKLASRQGAPGCHGVVSAGRTFPY